MLSEQIPSSEALDDFSYHLALYKQHLELYERFIRADKRELAYINYIANLETKQKILKARSAELDKQSAELDAQSVELKAQKSKLEALCRKHNIQIPEK